MVIVGFFKKQRFIVGLLSIVLFIGLLTGFVFVFRVPESEQSISGNDINAAGEYEKLVTPTPTPTDTPAPTPTETPTPTPSPSPTPTPTFTPRQEEFAVLYEQYLNNVEKYGIRVDLNSVRSHIANGDNCGILATTISDTKTLPAIHITTLNEEKFDGRHTTDGLPKNKNNKYIDYYIHSIVDVFNCDEKYEISAFADVKVRGNASAANAPYPLRIKFEEKQSMLGLNKNNDFKNWVLLKPWTCVCSDYFAFKLGQRIYDGKYYISDCCFVNVYVNGNFYGVYLLAEQNQVKKNRVNVNEPEEGETGTKVGYLLEIDNYAGLDADSNPAFRVTYRNGAKVTDYFGTTKRFYSGTFYTIHSEVTCDEQVDFISKYTNGVFDILYYAVEQDRYYALDENNNLVSGVYDNAEDAIGAVLDIEAAVETYIIEELLANYDRGNGSFYMAVDFSPKAKYKKLTFLAPWDFNWVVAGREEFIAGAFDNITDLSANPHPWFILLLKEEWFRAEVAEKWNELCDDGTFNDVIEKTRVMLEENRSDIAVYDNGSGYAKGISFMNNITKRIGVLDRTIKTWANDEDSSIDK